MDVRITTRHCSISDTLRRRTAERLEALQRYEPTLTAADVRFASDHGNPVAEVRLILRRTTLQASAGGETHQMALDAAVARAERQLRRRRERITDHKGATVEPPAEVVTS
ncbi:MAG TPA: ribosome-associated translation inhibitor RaiA [Longimicrobiales bacterium]